MVGGNANLMQGFLIIVIYILDVLKEDCKYRITFTFLEMKHDDSEEEDDCEEDEEEDFGDETVIVQAIKDDEGKFENPMQDISDDC
ncbi:hypothetical protein FRX31_018265 [Thalictrum thalictroides]|uniref:Uncharacterized protein n=1 Tax=Thalictrum thalictroides TaxID=46969 RepID=A0A7J6W442_THATH|nr:hypothetical protein FRX31_018265 [Thalictrum thalictroides]